MRSCRFAVNSLFSFAPHVPRRRADQLFFVSDDETELFIKINVLRLVGFEVTRETFAAQMVQIAAHESRADSLSLRLRRDTDRAKMQVRFVGIEMAPTGKPAHQQRTSFSEVLQQRSERDGQNFWRRKAIGRRTKMSIAANLAIQQGDDSFATRHLA